MTREIKFRCWDKDEKRLTDGNESFAVNRISKRAEQINIILMQYTGLKDIKGIEVYEGDIVKNGETILKVVWDTIGSQWEGNGKYDITGWWVENDETWMPFEIGAFNSWEVIGNIYENKDLLK